MPDSSSQTFLRELDNSRAERDNRSEAKIAPHTFYRGKLPKAARRGRAAARINRKNVVDKHYTGLQLLPESLIGLINLIAIIPLQHADLHAKDILVHVYEPNGASQTTEGSPQGEREGVHQYFLDQFALAEGKKGGQYFTRKSIVSLIVEMLEPYQGRVYDPSAAPAVCLPPINGNAASATRGGNALAPRTLSSRKSSRIPRRPCGNRRSNMRLHEYA